jgi:ketosteroid isomerase-like protein
MLAAAFLAAAPLAAQTPSPEDQVRAVAGSFSQALATSDSIGALALLHDDVLILEGTRAETKEQYRSGHLRADIAFAASVMRETLRDGVTIVGDFAMYTKQYRTTGMSSRGAPIDRTNIEALVLVRTPAGWRIQQVHWF